MTRSVIMRLLAASGLLYGIMEVFGDSLSSTTDSSQSPQQVAAYFASHAPTASTWAGMYVETIGAFALLAFSAYVWTLGRDTEWARILGALALCAGIIQTALILGGEPAKAAVFFRASRGELDPPVAAALLDLNNGAFLAGFMAQALLAAAVSGLAVVRGIYPRWLALPGFGVAAALLAVIATPAGSSLPVLVNLIFFLWLAAISVVLALRGPVSVRGLAPKPAAV